MKVPRKVHGTQQHLAQYMCTICSIEYSHLMPLGAHGISSLMLRLSMVYIPYLIFPTILVSQPVTGQKTEKLKGQVTLLKDTSQLPNGRARIQTHTDYSGVRAFLIPILHIYAYISIERKNTRMLPVPYLQVVEQEEINVLVFCFSSFSKSLIIITHCFHFQILNESFCFQQTKDLGDQWSSPILSHLPVGTTHSDFPLTIPLLLQTAV